MEISVEIDESLITAVDRATGIVGMSRQDAFREALEHWVAHMPKGREFSVELTTLEFDPDFVLEYDRPGPEAFSVPHSGATCTEPAERQ